MRLTDALARNLKLTHGATDHTFFDADMPGFGLRIRAGGSKTWVAMFRIGGRLRKLSIGSAAVVSEAKARRAARKVITRSKLPQVISRAVPDEPVTDCLICGNRTEVFGADEEFDFGWDRRPDWATAACSPCLRRFARLRKSRAQPTGIEFTTFVASEVRKAAERAPKEEQVPS